MIDACMSADAAHQAEMEAASATMLLVLKGEAPAPRGLRWWSGSGGWGKRTAESERRLAQLAAVERAVEARRIGGEPCPRCGARPRMCSHTPVKNGRLVCA